MYAGPVRCSRYLSFLVLVGGCERKLDSSQPLKSFFT